MMLRPEHEALIQGAIDGTLTPDEREAYRRLMAESAEAQNRADQLERLATAVESLGQASAPPDLVAGVLADISPRTAAPQPVRSFVHRSIPKRGAPVNKKLMFGLAAAAIVVLAVITYTSYPPATVGTEATIGAAQRAQAPQIAASDVKLADESGQELLQSETWDAIMKDEDLRTSLQDAEVRQHLQDPELRRVFENEAVRRFLSDPELRNKLADQEYRRRINEADLSRRKLDDANLDAALRGSKKFHDALRGQKFQELLARGGVAKALAGESMARVIRDRNFEAALRHPRFGEALARATAGKK